MVSMGKFKEKINRANRTQRHNLDLPKILFRVTRWNLKFPVTTGIKLTKHFIKRKLYQQSNMVVVVWQSEAASGWFSLIDGTMNSDLYQKILKKNLQTIVCALKLTWVMQQDKGPKHTSKKKKEQTNSGLHPPKNVMLWSCLENLWKMWLWCVFKESAIFHTGSDRSA